MATHIKAFASIKTVLARLARWKVAGAILALALFSALWFGAFPFRTLMGDDLWLIRDRERGLYATSFLSGFTDTILGKYRPVFSTVFALESSLFGAEYRPYFITNLLLHFLNACFFFFFLLHLTQRRMLLSFCSALLLLSSRFSYHYVLQLWGLMEEFGLFFFTSFLWFLVLAYQTNKQRYLLLASCAFFLLTFTHERFLILAGFVGLSMPTIVFARSGVSWRLLWSCAAPLIVAVNWWIKTKVIGIGFLAGAGSARANSPLEAAKVAQFTLDALLNALSISRGPRHLTGVSAAEDYPLGFAIGSAIVLYAVSIGVAYVWAMFKRKGMRACEPYIILFLFFALLGSTALSAAVSIHVELRWVYLSYVVLLIGLTCAIRELGSTGRREALLIIVLTACCLCSDIFHRQHLSNIYFVRSLMTADSARERIVERYGRRLRQRAIIIVTNGNKSPRDWTFLDNYFFRLHSKIGSLNVQYVDSVAELSKIDVKRRRPFVFSINSEMLVEDITRAVLAQAG